MPVWLYQFFLALAFISYLPGAIVRRRLPHRGWSMRMGFYPAAVIQALARQRPVWVHAVSVGEVLAAQPLVEALLRLKPASPVVLSTVTPGGFDVIQKRFGDRVVAVYFPLDFRGCVRRALMRIRPKALILMESELWPTMIAESIRSNAPVFIVNGRISARAFARYWRVRRWMKPMLASFSQYLMQSREDADRIIELGAAAPRVQVMGSLKWDASVGSRPDEKALQALAARLGLAADQYLWIAGSTHRGEEPALLGAFSRMRLKQPKARLVIAPRHLERLAEVEALVRAAGLHPARLSTTEASTVWDVGLVDSFGQLSHYYGLASLVFIGGSLIPHGGQNPLEATSLGKPVIFGRFMENFSVIAHQLLAHHAAEQVNGPEELARAAEHFVEHPQSGLSMGRQAREVTERFCGATQRAIDAIAPWLEGRPSWPPGYG